jgi:DnaK suppressor protein
VSTTSVIPYVTDDFLLRQRAELCIGRTSCREQVERLRSAAEELAEAGLSPDLGDDEGFAEADSLGVERDRILSLEAVARARLAEVEGAIRRLDAGAYGACRSCRSPIPLARLEAVPEANECVTCASGSVLRRRHHR